MTVSFYNISGGPSGTKNVQHSGSSLKSSKAEAKNTINFQSELENASSVDASSTVADPERAARVETLKAQVSAGTYNMDTNKVATALMQHLVGSQG